MGTIAAPAAAGAHFNIDAKSWGDVRTQSKLFEDVALVRPVANFNLTGSGEPERLQGARATSNLTSVLGVRPLMGRVWSEAEDRADARVALLSYRLWERRFGKDASILGRRIELNGEPFEILGVMPPEFRFPTRDFELWAPLFVPQVAIQGRFGDFNAVGRLRQGATIVQAQQEIRAIMDRDTTASANGFRLGLFAESFLDSTVGPVKAVLWTLLEAVGALLLIGCLSLGGLLVARAASRFRELSVRAALGADIARLRRQMLAETVPLKCRRDRGWCRSGLGAGTRASRVVAGNDAACRNHRVACPGAGVFSGRQLGRRHASCDAPGVSRRTHGDDGRDAVELAQCHRRRSPAAMAGRRADRRNVGDPLRWWTSCPQPGRATRREAGVRKRRRAHHAAGRHPSQISEG